MRVPVIERQEYTVSLQPYQDEDGTQYSFIHCDIHEPWSKSVKRKLQEDFALFCSLNSQHFLTLSDTDDRKHHKFLEMFGFKRFKTVQLNDGSAKEIFMKLEK